MEGVTTPEFSHKDRRDIYDYVERHGAMEPAKVREALGLEPHAFGHHVAVLRRDRVLEERNGKLRVAFEGGAEEEYRTADVSFTIRQAREEDLTGLVGAIRQAIGGGSTSARRRSPTSSTTRVFSSDTTKSSRVSSSSQPSTTRSSGGFISNTSTWTNSATPDS